MNSYTAPLRDIRFALYDVLGVEALYQRLGIAHAQRDLLDAVLDEAAKFTENVLAPINQSAMRTAALTTRPPARVTTPPGFKEAYAQFVEGGWTGLTASEAVGGQDLPESIGAAVEEMIDAANLTWGNYPLLSHGATEALKHHGEAWQQEVFLKPIVEGRWTGTMCLTEPHCGSDLGLLKTRAEPNADGTLSDHRHQDLHHRRRARPHRQHRPPGAGAPAGRAGRHQGHLAVHRAEDARSTRDGTRRRAQCASAAARSNTRWASTARPPA